MLKKTANIIEHLKLHAMNIFWSNFNQGVIAVSGLVVSIIFARFAGKELYGHYLFALAMLGLFSVISIGGTRTVIFRTIAQGYDGVYKKATNFSFLYSLFGVPLLLITGILFYLFKTKISGISLIVAALFFPFMTSLQNWMFFLKGMSKFRKLAIFNLMKFLANLVAVTASILFTKNLIVILLAYFLVHSCFNIFYHFEALRSLRNDKLDPGWRRQSYALTIMELSSIVFGRVDIVLIASLLSAERVAIYGLVMKLVGVLLMATKSTVEAIIPKLFKSEKITIRYFYKFFLLSFLIPIVLCLVIKHPILWMYGQDYSELILFTQVYLTVIPIFFLHSLAMNFMVKYKLNKEINFSKVIAIVAVILLYGTLIPLYGVWGGIISSILYYIIELVINLFLLKIRRVKHNL